jgi:glutamate dehydrogenase/leucine dehydrogenase
MSLYQSIQNQIKVAYAFVADEYAEGLLEYMLYPDQVHEVSIPVHMDNGTTKTFT